MSLLGVDGVSGMLSAAVDSSGWREVVSSLGRCRWVPCVCAWCLDCESL